MYEDSPPYCTTCFHLGHPQQTHKRTSSSSGHLPIVDSFIIQKPSTATAPSRLGQVDSGNLQDGKGFTWQPTGASKYPQQFSKQ